MSPIRPNANIVERFKAATPASAVLARRANELLPSGISHDGWGMDPYPIYVERARGPIKWDVDGNSYVDYFGGHGALLLGHNHPTVLAAVHRQLDLGTHFGSCHELGVRWAELVCRLIPSAERVRFTASGTEATLMALRIARAATGRAKFVRFKGHFHGWNDHMTSGHTNHFDGTPTAGVVAGIAEEVLLAEPNDTEGLSAIFETHKDIAAVIIEPSGASFGRIPIAPSFLRFLREITEASGALLIFDEVVTAFRTSPGGMQEVVGITPDLTTLAKILAGGLPGGAVAGRKDLLDLLDFNAMNHAGREKIQHPGTYNANPLSAAAGIATLEIIETTDACAKANDYSQRLRNRLNALLTDEQLPWAVYGSYSCFNIFTNPDNADISPESFNPYHHSARLMQIGRNTGHNPKVRLGLISNGVDVNGSLMGVVSSTHGDDELERTVDALANTIYSLRADGDLPARPK
ncbi:MAG: aminotransferase class III-fold pyridoxal phosphate-dependent enzyme [Alphaproteobacteria bacterium]|nr:aminotransferase class III-fold pyridoxal phosphate-dependent enzyme [Alphaproteobacteria bacterium]